MTLSLSCSPGAVSFLDDDADFLEMMGLVMPRGLHIDLFLRPGDCVAHLQGQRMRFEADQWRQQEIVDRWRKYCAPMIPQILRYWAAERARYGLTQVLVIDYAMPAVNGVELLRSLSDWPGARILLTGQADEQIAVDAFNGGLIQQFIPKQSTDLTQRLLAAIRRLQGLVAARTAHVWRSTLKPRQSALLGYTSVARDLSRLMERRRWVEHVIIGAPFGILGRDAGGHAEWLQLEPVSGLDELAELADGSVATPAALDDIRRGRQLVDLELRQMLGQPLPATLRDAFPIGSDEPLLGALFPLGREHGTESSTHEAFLASQPPRRLEP